MGEDLFREKIVKKYTNRKLEKKINEVWSIDEYMKFYEDNKKLLNSFDKSFSAIIVLKLEKT